MLRQNKPPERKERGKGEFGDLNESRAALGSAIRGKKILFVVDARDQKLESAVLPYAILEPCEAGAGSGVATVEDLLAMKPIEADALIIRSSRVFEQRIPDLLRALAAFRSNNPGCAVILCAYVGSVIRAAQPLLESGVVNCIESRPPNDFELLRMAADALGRLAPE